MARKLLHHALRHSLRITLPRPGNRRSPRSPRRNADSSRPRHRALLQRRNQFVQEANLGRCECASCRVEGEESRDRLNVLGLGGRWAIGSRCHYFRFHCFGNGLRRVGPPFCRGSDCCNGSADGVVARAPESRKVVNSFPAVVDYARRIHDRYFPDYVCWE